MEKDEEYPLHYIYHQLLDKLIIPKPIFIDRILPKMKRENEKGNREYKYRLKYNEMDRTIFRDTREKRKKEKVASQILYRLLEGNGKAVFIIGVHDNGDNIGINLKETFDSIHCLREALKIIDGIIKSIKVYKGREGYITTIRINVKKRNDYNVLLF